MDLLGLISESQCIAISGYTDRLQWAFERILSETKDRRFWSADVLHTSPRSAIALFPAKIQGAKTVFAKGFDAADVSPESLVRVMQELVGGTLRYLPRTEGRPMRGFEIRRAYRAHQGERNGLPVALIFATLC